ncbi:hypothetical protein HOY80DRAFT_950774 [Tuber brumale]|nr:hypothetical protein HOY80DRAFT_950774 [Tuber brumale]
MSVVFANISLVVPLCRSSSECYCTCYVAVNHQVGYSSWRNMICWIYRGVLCKASCLDYRLVVTTSVLYMYAR